MDEVLIMYGHKVFMAWKKTKNIECMEYYSIMDYFPLPS